jgi:ubiquitin C-terminal hydrolase
MYYCLNENFYIIDSLFLAPSTTIIPSNSSRIKSQIMIANFPNILCIQLKRFSYDRLSQTITKLTTNILIEPEKILDLSSIHYTTWLGLTNLSTTISFRYRLISVCLHLSSSSINGHYVCLYRTNHSQWFLSDDERITEINQIDNVFQTSYVTENCYLLFYERCS